MTARAMKLVPCRAAKFGMYDMPGEKIEISRFW
jgi:hypothetical protein